MVGDIERETGEEPHGRAVERAEWLAVANRAVAVGDRDQLVACALSPPSAAAFLDDDVEVRAIVARARREADGDDAFRIEARFIRLLPWTDAELRQSLALELVDRVRDHPSSAIRVLAELSYLEAFWAPEHLEDRLAHADRAVALALLDGLVELEIEARLWRFIMLIESARVGEAARELSCCESLATITGDGRHVLDCLVRRGALALLEGRDDDAETLYEQSFALAHALDDPDAEYLYATQQGILAFHRDDQPALGRILAEARLVERLPPLTSAGLFALYGDLDRATATLAVAIRDIAEITGPRAVSVLALGAFAADLVDDADAGRTLVDRLEPLAGTAVVIAGGVAVMGSVDHALALASRAAGRPAEAARWAQSGLELHLRMGATPWVERSRVLLAELTAIAAADDHTGGGDLPPRSSSFELRAEGRDWVLVADQHVVPLPRRKGFQPLAMLLAHPRRRIHVAELVDVPVSSAAAPRLDGEALAAYRRRLRDLDQAEDRADRVGDVEASARLADERGAIESELRRSRRPDGQIRLLRSDVERARVNVTRTIRQAIDEISRRAPDVGRHLADTVHTGTYCSYDPPPTG